jgi:aspartate racemase
MKKLGILGGMGPLPSAELVQTIYRLHTAEKEQELPACVLYSDPSIPDRTEAILAGDTREVTARVSQALAELAAAGVERIFIACVTAHHVLPDVPEPLRQRVVNLIDLVIDDILAAPRPCLLLCTTGTRKARIFERHERWGQVAEHVRFLDDDDQHRLHDHLYRLKKYAPPQDCLAWLDLLPAKYGVYNLIFGCTELHLMHRPLAARHAAREDYCIIDPMMIVARDIKTLL